VDTDHGFIENLRLFGMLLKEIEDGHPIELIECNLTSLHAIEKFPEGVIVLFSGHNRQRALRTGTITPQTLGQGRQRKTVLFVLDKDAHACEATKQAVDRSWVGLRGRSQPIGGPGAVLE
jgi:hypothetical protein